jgi:hypothetical protein
MGNTFEHIDDKASEKTMEGLRSLLGKARLSVHSWEDMERHVQTATRKMDPEWTVWLIDLGKVLENKNPKEAQVKSLLDRLEKF